MMEEFIDNNTTSSEATFYKLLTKLSNHRSEAQFQLSNVNLIQWCGPLRLCLRIQSNCNGH